MNLTSVSAISVSTSITVQRHVVKMTSVVYVLVSIKQTSVPIKNENKCINCDEATKFLTKKKKTDHIATDYYNSNT